jgi:7-cyano-7-deazaguanine synthase in queuosine biosynthesis
MKIEVKIDYSTYRDRFAKTVLYFNDGTTSELRIGVNHFKNIARGSSCGIDLLFLGSIIYAVDQHVTRDDTQDAWTRFFDLTVPVANLDIWSSVEGQLNSCLSFLTGDIWEVKFIQRGDDNIVDLAEPVPELLESQVSTVSLFSGGMDSLVGVIDWLVEHPDEKIILIGHHDKAGRDQVDQKHILDSFKKLRPEWTERIIPCHIPVWQSGDNNDPNYRSRSFMFISLAIYAASSLNRNTLIPVIIPENGTIAINTPLSPSRRGSCSTRTAHPFFIQQFQKIINRLGLPIVIVNPLIKKTKGEILSQCLDKQVLEKTYKFSTSCAKGGHNVHWKRRGNGVKHCGYCMPCIYRRAALHSVNFSHEQYGFDLCNDEIGIDTTKERAYDLRALLGFLQKKLDVNQIEKLLRATASFGSDDVHEHALLVDRALDEIRSWLRDCASEKIQRRAGLKLQ